MKWPACLAMTLLSASAAGYELDSDLWQRLVLTEVMVAPVGTTAQAGQWIEVHNPAEDPFNLQGVVLATVRGGFHVVSLSKPLVAEPDDTLLLAPFSDTEALPKGRVDYAYGGDFWLDTTGDIVLVLKAGKLVDVFAYGPESLPVTPGASFSLEPSASESTKEWCYGRDAYDPSGNLGTPGETNPACDGDGDGIAEDQGDCDDHDPAVNPGAVEVCNGLDDDCSGLVDDGVGPPAGPCLTLGVCAGTDPACAGAAGWACPYPEPYEADEVSCDGLDNDCDGETDEDVAPPGPCLTLGVCAGTDPACAGPGGWTCPYPEPYEADEVSCDGLDNDCDGETDEGFDVGASCTVGVGSCARTGTRACTPDRAGARCDVESGVATMELCGDGLDNDCDGATDEDFPVGEKCVVGTGACRSVGKYRCAEDFLSVICGAVPGPPESERCADEIDNDCDGETDEDGCGAVSAGGNGGCSGAAGPGRAGRTAALLVLMAVAIRTLLGDPRRVRRRHSGRSGMR